MNSSAQSLDDVKRPSARYAPWLGAMRGWLAVVFLIVLPWLNGGGYAYGGSLRATIAEAVAVLSLLILAVEIWMDSAEKSVRVLRHPGLWLILAFAGWAGLSHLWSADSLATAHSLRLTTALALVFVFALAAASEDEWRQRLMMAATASGVILAIGACYLRGAGLHPTGRFQYPYDHPAALAGALVWPTVILALGIVAFLAQRRWLAAAALSAAIIPCAAALWGSGTRSSLCGAGVGIVLGLFLMGRLAGDIPPRLAKQWRRLAAAIAVTSILATGGYALWLSMDRAQRETLYTGTFGVRVLCMATSCRMAWSKPLFGHGAGAFATRSAYYERPADFLHGQRGDVVYTAHCESAQILAELGLVGLALWLCWHLWPLWRIRRHWRQEANASLPLPFLMSYAAFAGMFADSCGSMSLRYLELPWHYAAAAGLAWAWIKPFDISARPDIAKDIAIRSRRAIAAALAAAALLYGCAVALPASCAQRDFAKCLAQWQNEAQARSVADHRQAILSAWENVRANAHDLYLWYFATQRLSRYAEWVGAYGAALASRRECLEHFAGDAINRKEMVRLLYSLGRYEEALSVCLGGLLLNPHDRYADAWLGRLLRGTEMGQLQEWLAPNAYAHSALKALGLTATERLYLELRLSWEAGNQQTAAAELVNLIERGDDKGIRLGLPRLHAGDWHYTLGNRREALALLQPLLAAMPPDPRALALAADILATSGDEAKLQLAYDYIARAVRLGRSIPQVVEVASALYIASRDPRLRAEAERMAREAVSYNPRDPELRRILVITLWRLGKRSDAEAALAAAESSFPDAGESETWEDLRQRLTSTGGK